MEMGESVRGIEEGTGAVIAGTCPGESTKTIPVCPDNSDLENFLLH